MKDESGTRAWRIATAIVAASIALVLVIGGGWVIVDNVSLRAENRAAHAETSAQRDNSEALYQQLLDVGVEPIADRPSTVTAPKDGSDGRNGENGKNATPEQISRAVAEWCIANIAACQGPPPPPAQDGADGADGSDGGKGDKGDPGDPGRNGRGIATGPTCQPDGTWLTTYDDGTTFTSAGPCRIEPAPEPTAPVETPAE